jgi:hypothetical protein
MCGTAKASSMNDVVVGMSVHSLVRGDGLRYAIWASGQVPFDEVPSIFSA